jgi:hypothetical protein
MERLNMTTPASSAEVTRELRSLFLTQPPATFGIEPTPEHPDVFGVVMEWLIDEVAVTVGAAVDGTTSVYTTRGMGLIGGYADEVLNPAARAFAAAAGKFFDEAAPVVEFPFPEAGRVQFYLRTFQGVRRLDASLESVVSGRDRYSGLYDLGWAVLERYLFRAGKTVQEIGLIDQIGRVDDKRASGPEGYVHCLLASLVRGIGRASITLSAGEPLPDLAALAAGNESLQKWLAEQGFRYEPLDVTAVVRVIRKTARMSVGLPFLTRRGGIRGIHVLDDGDVVACVFDVEIAAFDRSAKIHMAPSRDRRIRELQGEVNAFAETLNG